MEKKYKILLVDDDKFLLSMYSTKFEKAGMEIFSASDGVIALQKLEEGLTPDVILLDVILPNMDGLKFLEEYRKRRLSPSSAVIMLTNQSESTDIEQAKKLGVDGYIVKATTIPSEVLNEVIKLLEKRKAKANS